MVLFKSKKYINANIQPIIMADVLDEETNLKILKMICSGKGVSVNYSQLSNILKKHRDTIRKRTDELFKHKIINKPIYPFFGQFKDHSLMIIVQADIPLNKQFENWISTDDHIFAAYKLRRGEYNVLLILFHRSILRYQLWRKSLVKEGKIPPRDTRYPSTASFFSTQMMIKYEPSAAIKLLREVLEKRGRVMLNDYKVDKLSFEILEKLVQGEGIRVNENQIAQELGLSRKTVIQRINKLLQEHMVLNHTCRFPAFFCPPDSVLVISLLEVKKNETEIEKYFKQDPHISLAFQICHGRYNYLLFEVFEEVADHIRWEHEINKKFKNCIGVSDATYLTPNMMLNMDQQKVSLAMIKKRLDLLKHPEKEPSWNPFAKEE